MKVTPPVYAQRFLRWFCEEELYEEIIGDLDEAFYDRVEEKGYAFAKRMYIQDVVRFFKPYAWKKLHLNRQHTPMFRNYFKIGIRNIIKRKEYSLLNALGLIIGLTCIFLSILFLRNELRYDTFYSDSDDIYRIQRTYRSQEYAVVPLKDWWSTTAEDQQNYINELKKLDEVKHAIQFTSTNSPTSLPQFYGEKPNGERLVENNILWTNSGNEFFNVLDWTFVKGSAETALNEPHSVVLTESSAIKYFGSDWKADANLLSKNLVIDSIAYSINGVIGNVPGYSHVDFDLVVNKPQIPSWGAYTYIKKAEGFSDAQLSKAVSQAYVAFKPESVEDVLEKGVSPMPITSIYLNSKALYELKTPGDSRYLWIFGIIGLIILAVTITNYFNLSVALYAGRQKEIGVRKVLGAGKSSTITQFLFETLLITFGCLPVALLLMQLLLPFFNSIMGVNLENGFLLDLDLLVFAISLTAFIGLAAGLYPSIILSRKNMLDLFKGKLSNQSGGFSLRRLLVGFQFVLLIGLVTATFFINKQLDFLQNKDLGFKKDGVVSINVGGADIYQKMKNKLASNSKIMNIGAGGMPGNEMFNMTTYKMLESGEDEIRDDGTSITMDKESLEVLGIDHPKLALLDQGKASIFLINETAAKTLAATLKITQQELIGKVFQLEPEFDNEEDGTMGIHYTIDGILEDYHYFTLKEAVNPMFIEVQATPQWAYEMLVRISTEDLFATLDEIEKEYNIWHPDEPIRMEFLDDRLASLYKNEERIASLASGLSTIAVVLSILGLIGLVSFITKTKEREIGIRKVYGASVKHILLLLNKEFSILTLVATLLAAPLSFWAVNQWLEAFAYRIEPSFSVYAIAGLLCLLLVLAIVSIQSLRSVVKSPVESLKSDQ